VYDAKTRHIKDDEYGNIPDAARPWDKQERHVVDEQDAAPQHMGEGAGILSQSFASADCHIKADINLSVQ
jgi:hypothetical protein